MKRRYTAAAAMMMVMGLCASASAAFDENLNDYTLDTMVVEADAIKNKFGDTITEQSYYRTGGDVKVITREEIEKRHYTDVSEAIKRIPGVTFQNSGYRGGEYGFSFFNNSMSINGDSRVVILVDGRRVDNSVSTKFGSGSANATKTMADLNAIVNIETIDKIEVIKGPGASVYGTDATGGVINIITRKGGTENHGSIDLQTGSWHKHVYNLTYSGAAGEDKSWRYFISASRNMAQDSKYKDAVSGGNRTYLNTRYKEESTNIRVDKDFNEKQNLKISYNHQNGVDHYPILAPNYDYWSEAGWKDMYDKYYGGVSTKNNPAYRNFFMLDALSNSYNAYRKNDIDISYTFDKENGMESFIRVYQQKHHYDGLDHYPQWIQPDGNRVPFPGGPDWEKFFNSNFKWNSDKDFTKVSHYLDENKGVQFQYAKAVGVNDLIFGLTYDKSESSSNEPVRNSDARTTSSVKRDSIMGFVQDKIHVNDKWDVTPSVRYMHMSSYEKTNAVGKTSDVVDSNISTVTPSINTQYAFDDTMSAYFGWSKVYRPVKASDLTKSDSVLFNGQRLEDEKGNAFTMGLRKDLSDKTSIAVHYDYTDMSNAVTQYRVFVTSENDYKTKFINAKEKKKSFNLTADHTFDDHWNLSLGYSHLKDEWGAKNGMTFDPELNWSGTTNINTMINKYRPTNHYTANLSYENNSFYAALLANYFTGCDNTVFTDSRFMVLDLSLNYAVNKDLTTYLTINNLTNTAYENAASYVYGPGAAPQPGRCIMVGMKYTF